MSAEKLIRMTDAFITTTSATLDREDLVVDYKVATVLCFHFGVLTVAGAYLGMDRDQLRTAIFQYFAVDKKNDTKEAAYIMERMFELGETDIGKDIMQHGAFAYDAWVNGGENAVNALKDLIDDRLELDAYDPLDDEYEEEDDGL